MRHFYYLLTPTLKKTIFILFICLCSCKSETQIKHQEKEIEHYITGEWYSILKEEPEVIEDSDEGYLETQFEIESTLKILGKNQYYKENRFLSSDVLKITYLYTTGSVTMKFRISSSGVWSIKNNTVLFDTNFPSLDIDFKGSDASNSRERELVKYYSKEISTTIKKEYLENEAKPSKIIKINKTTMELEDSDGLILKYKRMSKMPKEFDISILPNDNFSEEQLRMGKSVFDRMSASSSSSEFLGAVVPKSEGIKLYDNKNLNGKSVHILGLLKNESQFKKALIVFDIVKDNRCGQHFKVLSRTGHFGWISGCSNIDTKWIKIDEAFTKNQTEKYKKSYFIKELESVYSNE